MNEEPIKPQPQPTPLDSTIVPADSQAIKDFGQLNLNTQTEYAKSGELLVVMNADKSTVVQGPDQLPYHTTNRKAADAVAKEVGGVVVGYKEAIKLVMRNPKNW